MSADLDRFDRMLLAHHNDPLILSPQTGRSEPSRGAKARASQPAGSERRVQGVTAGETAAALRQPVITSTRGPKYVDHMTCPMCGTDGQGVEYHGQLMSGAKVHTIAAHAAGIRRAQRGQPRCLGAGMRIVFVEGIWKGAPS